MSGRLIQDCVERLLELTGELDFASSQQLHLCQ